MLSFIGTGSAFNTKLGNNGAFIKKDDVLFMIDCGSSTFARMEQANLLEGVRQVYVLMTHTHPDHVGSLGDLIFHGYYQMGELFKPSVTVLAPSALEIEAVLDKMGVKEETYNLEIVGRYGAVNDNTFHINFSPVAVTHVKELNCFGYKLVYEGINIYYSGDSNAIPVEILQKFYMGSIDLFYQDTCKADYEGNVHLSLKKLDKLVGEFYRDRVWCMHIDKGFNREEAEALGFNVVKSILEG